MGTKTKPSSREHPDSVYLFRIVGTDLYKIGISGNVSGRLENLQRGMPFDMEVVCVWTFEIRRNSRALESRLKTTFVEHQVKGEWFRFSPEDVARVNGTIADFIESEFLCFETQLNGNPFLGVDPETYPA